MDRRGLAAAQVATYLEISPPSVSRWLSGKAMPSPASCAKLASLFGDPVEHVYQLAGHPMDYEVKEPPRLGIRERGLEWLASLPVQVPVYEQLASAGPGQQVMDYVYLERGTHTDGRYIALRARGDSMEPDIHDGDTVIIDTEVAADAGDTVVATVGDEVYVKKLRKKNGHLVLAGRSGDIDADDAKIEGVAIQVIHNLRR